MKKAFLNLFTAEGRRHEVPTIKNTIKQATLSAISAKDNQFRRQYLRLTIEQGIATNKAKLTVARSLLATLYGMWRKGEEYDPEIANKRDKGNKK